MSVTWSRFRCNDNLGGLTLEEIYKRFAAFSGVHDFSFDDLYSLNTVTVTGTVTGWNSYMLASGLPPNFSVKYHKTDAQQGLYIYASGSSGISHEVTTDSSGYPEIIWGGTKTYSVPVSTPTEADVEIVFRQQILDDRTDVVWRTITVYMNDAWVTTFSDYLDTVGNNISIGLMVYGTGTRTYTNVRVAELCDIAEFGTIDPGDTALAGLQRTIEGRYLKMLMRYDGSLRAWRKKQRTQVMEFEIARVHELKQSDDFSQLVSHARMAGAYIFGESIDRDLIAQHQHRFQEVNNAMLLTKDECYVEAANTIKRSEENAYTLTFRAPFAPVLEPEDRIRVNNQDWVINSYDVEVRNGSMLATYDCRKYVWA